MRAPGPLCQLAVDCFWSGPTFRTAKNNHRPDRPPLESVPACVHLNGSDFSERFVQRASHELVHQYGIIAFHEVGLVTIAAEKLLQFLVTDASKEGGIGNFVTVQVQNRQHRSIVDRIQEFVRMPTTRQRPGFSLAIADNASDYQVRIVKGGAVTVGERVTEFPPFVNRSARLGRCMTGNAARERELLKEAFDTSLIQRDVRVDLTISSLQIRI